MKEALAAQPESAAQATGQGGYGRRIVRLILGLTLFAIGSYLTIQANIGLAPWEAFSMGVSHATGLLYGNVVLLTGLVVLGLDIALKEKIGLGTILDILLIGKLVDLLLYAAPVPKMHNFWLGVLVLLVGQFITSIGCVFYIGAGFSCGPRDALMMALYKKLHRAPIGLIKGAIEGAVLLVGWLLGAKVGLGTVIAVFGVGFILQFTCKLFRFDAKAVPQEDIVATVRGVYKPAIRRTNDQ